ncbi:hypothetical protein [Nitrosomonas sp.]|uniref:hypothetical protein n=1 Tax=Nitrosomonas sp. TaxID=42353 RepID=UPI0025EC28F7|nr:hypothetical protein [Nitrosomonas sp.]MBV6447085.1 hypothetical protein [Nitrosomonas sp.]MBV6447306.1 hypothetical protein [Nitrosomonas sp.]
MSDKNHGDGCPYLTEEQVEEIAERAAARALNKMADQVYREVGKGVVSKALWLIGVIAVGVAMWLNSKGFLNG